jgi:hypothetical protein
MQIFIEYKVNLRKNMKNYIACTTNSLGVVTNYVSDEGNRLVVLHEEEAAKADLLLYKEIQGTKSVDFKLYELVELA